MKHAYLYSLFEKQNGHWVRISLYAFMRQIAIEVYGQVVADSQFTPKKLAIRPVRPS